MAEGDGCASPGRCRSPSMRCCGRCSLRVRRLPRPRRWEDAVGAQIAANARPTRLSDGVLFVEVDEPGWATQLRYLEAQLIERITAVAGPGVTQIELRVRRRGRA